MNICCTLPRGKIYIALASAYKAGTAGLMPVGNAMDFTINASVDKDTVPNMMDSSGGNHCVVYTVKDIMASLKITCQDATNLSRAMYGETTSAASAVVLAEPHKAFKGGVIALLKHAQTVQSVTGAGGTPTYAAGTDYILTAGGAISIPAASPLANGTDVLVNYTTPVENDTVQLFTNSGQEFYVYFEGVDKVSGAQVQEKLYRVRFEPATFTTLTNKLNSIDLKGELLPDESITYTALTPYSQYGTISFAGA